MGKVVQLQLYKNEQTSATVCARASAMVPVEFALGISDRAAAITKLQLLGFHSFQQRSLKGHASSSLCMMSVADAINANKKILANEDLSIDEIAARIDLIQMLENVSGSLLEGLWDSISDHDADLLQFDGGLD